MIYIGDETRDIEAAKKYNIASIAVSWGFNESSLLEKSRPDLLTNNPAQILPYIEKFDQKLLA